MEFLTRDTALSYSTDGTEAYKEFYGLESFPDMGGDPNQVEVTNMRDRHKRNINGLEDMGSLSYEFFYNREEAAAAAKADPTIEPNAFQKLKELEALGTPIYWKQTYPDGSFYSWQGTPSTRMKGGKPDEALKFSVSISVETTLEYSAGEEAEGNTDTTEEGV